MKEKHSVVACRKHLRQLDNQILELNIAMSRSEPKANRDELDQHRQLSNKREAARLLLTALTSHPSNNSNCATTL